MVNNNYVVTAFCGVNGNGQEVLADIGVIKFGYKAIFKPNDLVRFLLNNTFEEGRPYAFEDYEAFKKAVDVRALRLCNDK